MASDFSDCSTWTRWEKFDGDLRARHPSDAATTNGLDGIVLSALEGVVMIKARLHGGVSLEAPDQPRLRRSPVVDALGRRLWDGHRVRDAAGRTGTVERTLGVPPGPWAARGSERALGRLEVLWDDGDLEYLVRARDVVKTKSTGRVPR